MITRDESAWFRRLEPMNDEPLSFSAINSKLRPYAMAGRLLMYDAVTAARPFSVVKLRGCDAGRGLHSSTSQLNISCSGH